MAKKLFQEKYFTPLWNQTNPNDPKSIAQTLTTSLQVYDKFHILDPHVQGMLKNAELVGMQTNDDGKDELSTQQRTSFSLWKSIAQSSNPQLLKDMDPKAQTLYSTFDDLSKHMPEADAWRIAKHMATPDAKEAVAAQWPHEVELNLSQNVQSDLQHYGGGVYNNGLAAQDVIRLAKIKTGMVNLAPKQAVEQALAEYKQTHVFDGQHTYVEIPVDANRDEVTTNIKQYAADAVAALKQGNRKNDPYTIQLFGSGANAQYRALDAMGHDIVPPQTMQQLRDRVAEVAVTSPVSIYDADKLSKQLDATTVTNGAFPSAPSSVTPGGPEPVTPQQASEYSAQRLLELRIKGPKNGGITTEQYQKLMDLRQQKGQDDLQQALQRAKQAQQTFSVPGADDILNGKTNLQLGAQTPQPGGFNLQTKDYTLQALSKGDLDFALTSAGEGLKLSVSNDPNQRDKTIGLGYNLSARFPGEIATDFKRAGIDQSRIPDITAGKASITPQEAMRLYAVTKDQYVGRAKQYFGDGWDKLPDNVKSVLTDMAYVGNKRGTNYDQMVDLMRQGKFDDASKLVDSTYTVKDDPTVHHNIRRVNLWRGMMAGTDTFQQMIEKGV